MLGYPSTRQVFQGNKDSSSTVSNILKIKARASAIRIYPITYNIHPTLRVELYHSPRCPPEGTMVFSALSYSTSVQLQTPHSDWLLHKGFYPYLFQKNRFSNVFFKFAILSK